MTQYSIQEKVQYCWDKLEIAVQERDINRARKLCAIINGYLRNPNVKLPIIR